MVLAGISRRSSSCCEPLTCSQIHKKHLEVIDRKVGTRGEHLGLGFLSHGTPAKGRGPLPDPLVTQGQDIGDTVKATSLVLSQRTLNDHLCLGNDQSLLGVISLVPNGFLVPMKWV